MNVCIQYTVTKMYYRKTVGHAFAKPVQIEGTTQKFSPIMLFFIGFGGLGVACWPLVPQVWVFKPGRSRRIFRAKKSSARLPSEGK